MSDEETTKDQEPSASGSSTVIPESGDIESHAGASASGDAGRSSDRATTLRDVENIAIEMLNLLPPSSSQRKAYLDRAHASNKEFKFWSTQPVPKLSMSYFRSVLFFRLRSAISLSQMRLLTNPSLLSTKK